MQDIYLLYKSYSIDSMEKGKKLPAADFCNKEGAGKANPIYGKGALGNQFSGRMFYTGSNKEEFVTLVQLMLIDLGYEVGSSGADGKFGNDTEKAVKKFQEEHEDWGGEKLNVDGLVGPETADSLNRAMVVAEGRYDFHQTETCLTIEYSLLTAKAEALKEPVSLDVDGIEKGKVILTSAVIKSKENVFSVRLHGSDCKPLGNASYRITTSGLESSGVSDPEGWVHIEVSKDQCYARITLAWDQKEPVAMTLKKDLIVECEGEGEERQLATARLHNIGYGVETYSYDDAVKAFQSDYDIPDEYGLDEDGNLPPKTKKRLWWIYGEGMCDAS
jgi:hypothetical protein